MEGGEAPRPLEANKPVDTDRSWSWLMPGRRLLNYGAYALGALGLVGAVRKGWQMHRMVEGSNNEGPEYAPKSISLDLLKKRLKDRAFKKRIFGANTNETVNLSDEQITAQLGELFDIFFQTERENTKVFHAPNSQASFLYTSINVADMARKLAGIPASPLEPEDSDKRGAKKFFIFSNGIIPTNGNQFTLSEEAFIECMKQLQIALKDIKLGKQPRDYQIYTLGMPTNEFGEVSPQFVNRVKQQGFPAFGQLYGECVESIINQSPTAAIEFYGWSMGANFAVNTGEDLLRRNLIGQYRSAEENPSQVGKPKLQILVDNPVGYHNSLVRQLLIPIGFGVETAYQLLFNTDLNKGGLTEGKMMAALEPELAQKGIMRKMDPVQSGLKNEVLNTLEFNYPSATLFVGQDPAQIKAEVYMRTGTHDPIEFSPSKNQQAQKKVKKGKFPEIYHTNPNVREFMANMSHMVPFFRDNMLVRWAKTAITVGNLRKTTWSV